MPFATCHRHTVAVVILLLFPGLPFRTNATTITTVPAPTSSSISLKNLNATCEFRTINYITNSLPQLCLKSSWSNTNNTSSTGTGNADIIQMPSTGTTTTSNSHTSQPGQDEVQNTVSSETRHVDPSASPVNPTPSSTVPAPTASDTEIGKEGEGELNDASFLSFEDWKKQTLEKAGQQNSNIGNRRPPGNTENKKRDAESIQTNLDSLGDEGEIDLDFAAFRSSEDVSKTKDTQNAGTQDDTGSPEGSARRKGQYRSKDAGVTCKERFSYSSFDAGATILKTHPGAKNAKAVLIENKDSYMLSECAAENKFLIVELSEDIWIDTLVLANYEFFSSMIRAFRVSVSDRYPVKHWRDLGVLEARNSREIQAFLIENPMIWARYLRLEFLNHYGNEYYCPLSLIRVHGTRMIENWKEEERGDEEDEEEISLRDGIEDSGTMGQNSGAATAEGSTNDAEMKEAQSAIEELVKTAGSITPEQVAPALNATRLMGASNGLQLQMALAEQMMTPWSNPSVNFSAVFSLDSQEICLPAEAPEQAAPSSTPEIAYSTTAALPQSTTDGSSSTALTTSQILPGVAAKNATVQEESPSVTPETQNITRSAPDPLESTSITSNNRTDNTTASHKQKTTTTSTASTSLPTIQESFFKAVSRRLQLLEANSTLSLKYIEEQSKILREAFTKVERKQLQKTTAFLENLNNTVLAELRGFRQQYDEIWQSTVISLESQREESQREILAISARLNILADEVVFQKRMSIVQACLLLLCLGLVIFSRVSVSGGHLDFPGMQNRSRLFLRSPVDTPPHSPEYHRVQSLRAGRPWFGAGHRRQRSDESAASRSPSGDDSPPTPVSNYSRSENEQFPQSGFDEQPGVIDSSRQSEPPSASRGLKQDPRGWEEDEGLSETFLSPSTRAPRSGFSQPPPMATPRTDSPTDQYPFDKNHEEHSQSMDMSDIQPDVCWTRNEHDGHVGVANRSLPLPSPPPEQGKREFSIVRKPLPALPSGGL